MYNYKSILTNLKIIIFKNEKITKECELSVVFAEYFVIIRKNKYALVKIMVDFQFNVIQDKNESCNTL